MRICRDYTPELLNVYSADVKVQKEKELIIMKMKADFFKFLSAELQKCDGKKVTKRVVTNLEKLIKDTYTISFYRHTDKWTNTVKISAWAKSMSYEERFTFELSNDELFDYLEFKKKQDYWFTGVQETIKRTEKILKNVHKIVERYNKAVKKYNDALAKIVEIEKEFN
jgi:hypothetical protein